MPNITVLTNENLKQIKQLNSYAFHFVILIIYLLNS